MTGAARFRLDGRTAAVTGAASGIGRASAVALAESGADVVIGDVDEAGLDETRRLAAATGRRVTPVPTDVTVEAEVQALVDRAVTEHGRLDVMVNVAGVMVTAELTDLAEDQLDHVLAVNLKGVWFGIRSAAPAMREAGGGSIVVIASSGIDVPAAGLGAYAMSKAAVVMLTRTAAVELGKAGIRVNAVAPGYVETAMTERRFVAEDGTVDEEARQGYLRIMRSVSPLGRTGRPDDIADAVVYLASDASSFVTGQILRPNGGATMPW